MQTLPKQIQDRLQTLPKQVRDRLQTLIAKGIGQSMVIAFWSMGGTPKTHLVPLFCSADKLAVDTKHILSSALTVVIQKYQVTSLYGVSPILHRIKNAAMACTVPKISTKIFRFLAH